MGCNAGFLQMKEISGIGVDIIEIERIRKIAEKSGERFLRRVFTPNERAYCEKRYRPYENYAARFAAKEAVLKALGTGLASGAAFADVEILRTEKDPPKVRLHNKTAKLAENNGIDRIMLSLSHDQSRAIAFAIAIKTETEQTDA